MGLVTIQINIQTEKGYFSSLVPKLSLLSDEPGNEASISVQTSRIQQARTFSLLLNKGYSSFMDQVSQLPHKLKYVSANLQVNIDL